MRIRNQTVRLMVGVRRTARRTNIVKVAAKTAMYSVVPSTLNDVMVHHVSLSIIEVKSIATDTVIVGALSMALKTFVPL